MRRYIMSNLYLFENFNNYYNRTFKGERATVHDYPIEEAYGFYGINFYPADNVHTTQMINLQTNAFDMEPDYLLVCEDSTNRIVSRWFVIESKQTRGGQIELSLRRDLIADYFNIIKESPLFVEKAITTDSDPAIFNREDMSFNQIKTKEILLKDQSPCAWIVGYYNPETVTEESIAVDSEVTNAITKPLGTTMAAFLGNYTNFQDDYMVSKKFLERENIKAHNSETTRNCKEGCSGCGVKKDCGGVYCG